MKILIVKVSALGDVIHALPVLSYIHQVHPDAHIDWLVEEGFAPILENHPQINEVLRVNTREWRNLSLLPMFREIRTFVRSLRRQHYDFVFDLQGNSKSALLTLLSKGKDKYGFSRREVREWPNVLATRHRVQPGHGEQHVARRALAVVRAALPGGGDVPLCGPLYIADEPKKQIEDYMEQLEWVNKTIVVFHYGTTWRTKLWDLNMWQQLAAKLTQRPDTSIILTWGSTEEHRAAEKIIENLDGEIVIWPRVPLPEFAALLARADLVVGGDTGPVHIAAAAGTPTVSMYRATDALRNGPEGEKHIRLQSSMPCAKCLRKECEYDPQCSTSIRVEDVMNAISNILDVKSEGA